MSNETLKTKVLKLLKEKNMKKADLLRQSNLKKSTFYNIFDDKTDTNNLNLDTVKEIARALNVSVDYLIDNSNNYIVPEGMLPINKKTLPILGTIACGKPINNSECFDGYADFFNLTEGDFALYAQGDSMINARIFDGDLVAIKSQPEVENGEIAAVRIDGEDVTLKRFYKSNNTITLVAENPKYQPIVFQGADMAKVRVEGKAIIFQSVVR